MRVDEWQSAATLATGWARLIGPSIAVCIALFAFVMSEPLLSTRVVFFTTNEIVLTRVVRELYNIDIVLFLVVLALGIIAPGLKLILFAVFWYALSIDCAHRYNGWLVLLGKLAHGEVMLIALGIVAIRGFGIGTVDIELGLYVYILLISGSFMLSLYADDQFRKLAQVPRTPTFASGR
jgi:hypothetical protein